MHAGRRRESGKGRRGFGEGFGSGFEKRGRARRGDTVFKEGVEGTVMGSERNVGESGGPEKDARTGKGCAGEWEKTEERRKMQDSSETAKEMRALGNRNDGEEETRRVGKEYLGNDFWADICGARRWGRRRVRKREGKDAGKLARPVPDYGVTSSCGRRAIV